MLFDTAINGSTGDNERNPVRYHSQHMIQKYVHTLFPDPPILTHTLQCYLCPGNKRVQGQVNPNYGSTFVFANDYSAVQEEQAEYHAEHAPGSLAARLLQAEAVTGKCYVITFSPHHHITLADMKQAEILVIIQTWTNLYKLHLSPNSPLAQIRTADLPPLNQDDITKPSAQYRYMQIFENKGKEMGCSNPHPHGQIWTTTSLPEEPCMELVNLQKYKKEHGTHLLVDYAQLESEKKERTVCENRSFWAGVPHWAVWPFEIMIVSKRHKRALVDLDAREREELADTIAQITRHYDNLFETRFPYSKFPYVPATAKQF